MHVRRFARLMVVVVWGAHLGGAACRPALGVERGSDTGRGGSVPHVMDASAGASADAGVMDGGAGPGDAAVVPSTDAGSTGGSSSTSGAESTAGSASTSGPTGGSSQQQGGSHGASSWQDGSGSRGGGSSEGGTAWEDGGVAPWPHGWTQPMARPAYIAHALGGVDGVTYTNSLEAFEANYALGHRWFEVDLHLTADGDLVCFHDNHEPALGLDAGVRLTDVTTQDFLSRRYNGTYTLLSFEGLLRLVQQRPGALLVTDTKGWSAPKIQAFERHLSAVDPALNRRMVPQVYNGDELAPVVAIQERLGHPFASLIFTLYLSGATEAQVISFVRAERIPVVTMPSWGTRASPTMISGLHDAGAFLFVHTINSAADADTWTTRGMDGFYTDFLVPAAP